MGLFNGTHHSRGICPTQSLAQNATMPFVGSITFYEFNRILSGSCAALACLIILPLMVMHATHLSKPNEQLKIMRICLLIPFYGILSFLQVYFPTANVYIAPWLDFVQAIALASFFLLLCEFVSPSREQRDVFFAAMEVPARRDKTRKVNGLGVFRRVWIFIFQYPVVSLGAAILTDITQATGDYCEFASKPGYSRLWITLVQNASITFAVGAVLRIYSILKIPLKDKQPLAKLLAFKLIVFLTTIEGIIFWILKDNGILKPSSKLTWADLNYGILDLLVCIEMVPFAIFFHHAYSARPYFIRSRDPDMPFPQSYQGGPLGAYAWLGMLDIGEILSAIGFAFTMAREQQKQRKGGSDDAGYDLLERQHRGGETAPPVFAK